MHLGSFLENDAPVQPGLDLINEQQADYIFFTGDLVNSSASEAEYWIPHFKKLKAKRGKFSVLGNHDYGYGIEKGSQEDKDNLARVKAIHGEMGFDLLLNETKQLEIEGQSIDLIGVENWGSAERFPKFGDFKKATKNTDLSRFNILLSHDPTHWEQFIMKKENVNLTLSGHTHGFQFGVGLGKYKLNLGAAAYKRWNGLYKESENYLYVNTGFGFLGFPGRVNMPPEITVFTLNKV
jgi:predicted MPP superfamily phosphohydrolase